MSDGTESGACRIWTARAPALTMTVADIVWGGGTYSREGGLEIAPSATEGGRRPFDLP